MPITRTDEDQTFSQAGVLLTSTPRVVDITAETIADGTITRARAAFTANRSYLAIPTPTNAQVAAQVRALTRQNQGLIRLVARDLLTDEVID